MAQLIVDNGPHQGKKVKLSREGGCSIGSDPDCDLSLPEPGIAARHLVVKALRDSGFGVRCLDSTFLLNNRDTEAARLKDGDVLEIGGTRIRYRESARSAGGGARRSIGGFRLLEVLGVGGMGTVYRAEQVNLDREVALKVLSKDLTQDPVFVARFVAEARAAARLHHPNVVQVFDVGHDGDTYYYSMELMQEGSIEERLKALGTLPVEEALAVIADAARGLAYAESLRIVHRDIKPDNLMLDHHGHVKIADLGLAMTDEDNVSKVIGTPHFMSPEQALGKPLDHRSDLYSLGCTFYRLLSGKTPFKRDTVKEILRAHVKDQAEPVHKVVPDVPAEVSAIVERLMAKDPTDRYQSAAEVVEDIEEVLAPPSRKGLILATAAAAILVAGGALVWGLTRPEGKDRVIHERVEDLEGIAKLQAQLRQRDAELAYLRVAVRDLEGLARAEALDGVANGPFGDSEWGRRARDEAAKIRGELARAAAERQAHAQAVAAAAQKLREDVGAALSVGDYAHADDLLSLGRIPEELRDEPAVQEARDAMHEQLRAHADKQLASLRAAVEDAKRAQDPDAVHTALVALEPVLDPENGWPDSALPNRDELASYVKDTKAFVDKLVGQLNARSVEHAWQSYRDAVLGDGGVMDRVDRLDFDGAASAARAVAGQLQEFAPGTHAARLAASLDRAQSFLLRFEAAATDDKLVYQRPGDDEPYPVLELRLDGDERGLVVKAGPAIQPHKELVELAGLRGSKLAPTFRIPGEPDEEPARAAFLGWVALADHLRWGREYLERVHDDLDSGTGKDGYPGGAQVLVQASQALERLPDSWATALRSELESAQLVVRALRAFSARRNRSAVKYLERLCNDHGHTLLAAALRQPAR